MHLGAVVADAPSPLSTPRSAAGQAQLRLGKPLCIVLGKRRICIPNTQRRPSKFAKWTGMPASTSASRADTILQPVNRATLVPAQFAENVYGWTECVDNSTDVAAFDFSYTSSLWSNELDWMRLPPGTHLLLFGRSSMAQASSALRSGNRLLGALERTEVKSHADFCVDAAAAPHDVGECSFQCSRWMNCGPLGAACDDDPHSVTVDYLAGGSTITTISNHPQSQRLGSRLDDWLHLAAPENATVNFTHGAFMDPHPDFYFDRDCQTQWRRTRLSPRRRAKFSRSLYCKPQSDAACTERHPHFDVVSRWVTGELASVLEPPRKHSKHRKHNNEIPFDSAALQMADTVRDAFRLRCVTDSQVQNLTECPNGRNTTLWLLQAQEAYEYNNAAASAPATCSCKHICNARCVQRPGSNEAPHCYMGPGLAAAWLILRAAGLATRPSHKIPMRV